MKTAAQLRGDLRDIDRRSYPAYKSLAGSFGFGGYILHIEHVQGDPFAAPSRLRVEVSRRTAAFPDRLCQSPVDRRALADCLLRRFDRQAGRFSFQAKGSGKSGVIAVSRCGQEVLERTACEITDQAVHLRFEVGFPANGRTINAPELEKILFEYLPVCVEQSLFYAKLPKGEAEEAVFLAEDQAYIRQELERRHLAAFVADGAVLPRESGVSDRPMAGAVPFAAPETMAVELDLPHRGRLRGMGVPEGITLIAGGGYHGKSTLLKALERGVYDHVAGDGREYVITRSSALKIRAEDGRKITNTDVSLFINHLPNGRDTVRFSTLDASGSTSQAANIIEGIESGSRVLLIDEDTSAANLMARDGLMRLAIAPDKEPITPFLERVSDLYKKAGVSVILVVGSCGDYFHVADKVLQMDAYRALDITDRTRALLEGRPGVDPAPDFRLPADRRTLPIAGAVQTRRNYRGSGTVQERLKVRRLGKTAFSLGGEDLDLRYVEQLVDGEQTQALACILRYVRERWTGQQVNVREVVDQVERILETEGLAGICGERTVPSGLAMPRRQEIFACLNRC